MRIPTALRELTSAPLSGPSLGLCLAGLIVAQTAMGLPDHLSVVTTNLNTHALVTLELDRYSLRGPNWEARIYSSPTTYTVVPSDQVPEVTTYRGRTTDGGMVYGGVRPNGTLYARVNYGCRQGIDSFDADPYEGTSRYSWAIGALQLSASVVNGYVYAPAANAPIPAPAPPANWYNNLGATQNFGGPPPFNNLVKMPLSQVRLICSMNEGSYGLTGHNLAYALLSMESAINECDYVAARDSGVAYRIEALGIQTYPAGDVDTSADWSDMAGKYDVMYWVGNWGVAAGWSVICYWEDMAGGTGVHELGHVLGGPDFPQEADYQGQIWNTEHAGGGDDMNGVDLIQTIGKRAAAPTWSTSWVYYRTPVPTRANPDFASTLTATPVDVDVLLNDRNANTTNRDDLSVVSFQNPSERGGTVTNLGGGVLRYTPPAGFRGDDLFRYYVSDPSGNFKSVSGVRVLVADPNNPLIAHYGFDETTGVTAFDTSGCGHKATLCNGNSFDSSHVPGVGGSGGAIHLSGSANLTFGKPSWGDPAPDPVAAYSYDAMDRSQSVSFWYKPDQAVTDGQLHFLYVKNTWYYGSGSGFVIGISNNTLVAGVRMVGPIGNELWVDSGVAPTAGVWYHIVGEIDRENQQVHLYVNGVKVSSAAGVLPANQFVAGAMYANLGAQNNLGHWYQPAPDAAYDDLRIYTKALTGTEVTDLYEAPGMLPASPLAPAAGPTGITPLQLLSWGGVRARYQHDVYFGTDAAAVAAVSVSTLGIYLGRTSGTSRQITSLLDPSRTYFWRIDEVDGSTVATGTVWQFTTAVRSPACDLLALNWGSFVGSINGTKVTLMVPYGTNLTTLNPTCMLSPFATVTPASGSANNFASPVPYTVTAQDGTTKVYTVTAFRNPEILVNPSFNGNATGWTLTGVMYEDNDGIPAAGQDSLKRCIRMNSTNGTLTQTVTILAAGNYALSGWFATNTSNTAVFELRTSANVAVTPSASISPAIPVQPNWVQWTRDYTNLAAGTYTIYVRSSGNAIWADNFSLTDKAGHSTACDLVSFNSGSFVGTINPTTRTVSLVVSYFTDLTTLMPVCTASSGATISPSGAQNFSDSVANPVQYTVTSEAGDINQKTYAVTVTKYPASLLNPSFSGNATGWTLTGAMYEDNDVYPGGQDSLKRCIRMNTNGGTLTQTVSLVAGNYMLAGWFATNASGNTADFELRASGNVAVTASASSSPTILVQPNWVKWQRNYANLAAGTYTVYVRSSANAVWADNFSLTLIPVLSTACDLVSFNWGSYVGTINPTARTVSLVVPYLTDLTTLAPARTASGGATISPASGVQQDFSGSVANPLQYTVTAEDGVTTKTYAVTVTAAGSVQVDTIILDTFSSGSWAVGTSGRTPDTTDVPGVKWVGPEGYWFTNAGNTVIEGGRLKVFVEAGYSLNLASAGSYTYPTLLRIAADLTVNSLSGTANNSRPRGITAGLTTNQLGSDDLYTKIVGLNLRENGSLTLFDQQTNVATVAWSGAAAFNPTQSYHLSYDVDTSSGQISNISLAGSTADYSSLQLARPHLANAQYAAVNFNADAGGATHFGYLDNFSLSVTPAVGAGYVQWESANGASGGASADSNHNGVPNGIEYFMGGTALAPATLPPLANTAGTWTWTLAYDPAAAASYRFQLSDNLSGWTDLAPPDSRITVLTNPGRIRITLPAGTAKKFCRLLVTPVP